MVNPLNFFKSRKKKTETEDDAWQSADEALQQPADDEVEVDAVVLDNSENVAHDPLGAVPIPQNEALDPEAVPQDPPAPVSLPPDPIGEPIATEAAPPPEAPVGMTATVERRTIGTLIEQSDAAQAQAADPGVAAEQVVSRAGSPDPAGPAHDIPQPPTLDVSSEPAPEAPVPPPVEPVADQPVEVVEVVDAVMDESVEVVEIAEPTTEQPLEVVEFVEPVVEQTVEVVEIVEQPVEVVDLIETAAEPATEIDEAVEAVADSPMDEEETAETADEPTAEVIEMFAAAAEVAADTETAETLPAPDAASDAAAADEAVSEIAEVEEPTEEIEAAALEDDEPTLEIDAVDVEVEEPTEEIEVVAVEVEEPTEEIEVTAVEVEEPTKEIEGVEVEDDDVAQETVTAEIEEPVEVVETEAVEADDSPSASDEEEEEIVELVPAPPTEPTAPAQEPPADEGTVPLQTTQELYRAAILPSEPAPPPQKAKAQPQITDLMPSEAPKEAAVADARAIYAEALQVVGRFFSAASKIEKTQIPSLAAREVEAVANKIVSGMSQEHVGDGLVALSVGPYPDAGSFVVPHSVNIAILSQRVAAHLGLETHELQTLAVAALLHDVGTVRLARETFYKDDSLSNDEWALMRKRPAYSAEIIRALGPSFRAVAEIAHQVHERLDGNGYPRGLQVDTIALEASILGAVDIFEAFIHPRPYKKTVPAAAMYGVDNLMRLSHQFGDGVLKALVRSVGLFPVGTYVRLNSGEVARVLRGRSTNPMRPEVEVVFDTQKRNLKKARYVDLMATPHLYVFKPLSPEDLAEFGIK